MTGLDLGFTNLTDDGDISSSKSNPFPVNTPQAISVDKIQSIITLPKCYGTLIGHDISVVNPCRLRLSLRVFKTRGFKLLDLI